MGAIVVVVVIVDAVTVSVAPALKKYLLLKLFLLLLFSLPDWSKNFLSHSTPGVFVPTRGSVGCNLLGDKKPKKFHRFVS